MPGKYRDISRYLGLKVQANIVFRYRDIYTKGNTQWLGRSVCALCIGITVNPRRHPKAVKPHCHQGRPGESRGPGTVMLAVGRVHTLYTRGQLTRIPGAAPSGFGRTVRAPRIGITVNSRRHPKAVWSLVVTKVEQVSHAVPGRPC